MNYSVDDVLEAITETDALMEIYKEVHDDAPEERWSAMRMRAAVEAIKAYLDQREVHFENLSNLRMDDPNWWQLQDAEGWQP